jgi:hypothetical protein
LACIRCHHLGSAGRSRPGKKEGKVLIFAAPDTESRTRIPPLFKQRFGIDVEYVS